MAHNVVFSPEALADLLGLYDYIAEAAGAERALGYVDRLEAACRDLALFPGVARAATISAQVCVSSALNAALLSRCMWPMRP